MTTLSHFKWAITAGGMRCAVYKERIYQFKNNLDMKNEQSNTTEKGIAYDRLLYAGFVCPYCGAKTEYIDSSFVYGKSYGMIYICKPCDAYVGVHNGTDNALGRLANKELREAKKQAHYYFDQIAKTGLINKIWKQFIPNTGNRNKAYLWLSKQMNIERELCHIGMFDVGQCQKVIEICSQHVS